MEDNPSRLNKICPCHSLISECISSSLGDPSIPPFHGVPTVIGSCLPHIGGWVHALDGGITGWIMAPKLTC